MSMCRVISCVVGRGCLLWTLPYLGKTLLDLTYLLLEVSLDFLLLHSSPLWQKWHLFWMLVLEGLVSLHRTIQLQLLQHYWSGHRPFNITVIQVYAPNPLGWLLSKKKKGKENRVFPGGQWLRLWAPKAGTPGVIAGHETRFHMLKLRVHKQQQRSKIPCAPSKTWHSQVNK